MKLLSLLTSISLFLIGCNGSNYREEIKEHINKNELDLATEKTDSAFKLNSEDNELYLLKGEIEFKKKNYKEASYNLITYNTFNPLNPISWEILGRAQQEMDKKEGALKSFDNAYELEPNKNRFLRTVSLITELHKEELLEVYLDKFFNRKWNEDFQTTDSLVVANFLVTAQRPELALDFYPNVDLDSLSRLDLAKYSLTLQILEQHDRALQLSDYIVNRYPEDIEFINLQTHLLIKNSEDDSLVINNCLKSIKLSGSFKNMAYQQLAYVYMLNGNYKCCEIVDSLRANSVNYSKELTKFCP